MDDFDGGLSFDFEASLDPGRLGTPSEDVYGGGQVLGDVPQEALGRSQMAARRNYRQTVCRHWLKGLCMKGDSCGFLHQFDPARMPVCRFFAKHGECREPKCPFKHTLEDLKECNMYKLGFCPNGPDCRYRHQKLPGPPPPVHEIVQRFQQKLYNVHHGDYVARRPGSGGQFDLGGKLSDGEAMWQQQMKLRREDEVAGGSHSPLAGDAFPRSMPFASKANMLPPGSTRYFIIKSANRENLELSTRRGAWATHRNNEQRLNAAFDTVANVLLIYSVNESRHFQGCARMESKVGATNATGQWKYAHGTAQFGRNFRLRWLKLCELSFTKTRHLRNPYNENLPVKVARDCQELEPSVGEQLVALMYAEPDSELMAYAKKVQEEEASNLALSQERIIDTEMTPIERDSLEESYINWGQRGPSVGMWSEEVRARAQMDGDYPPTRADYEMYARRAAYERGLEFAEPFRGPPQEGYGLGERAYGAMSRMHAREAGFPAMEEDPRLAAYGPRGNLPRGGLPSAGGRAGLPGYMGMPAEYRRNLAGKLQVPEFEGEPNGESSSSDGISPSDSVQSAQYMSDSAVQFLRDRRRAMEYYTGSEQLLPRSLPEGLLDCDTSDQWRAPVGRRELMEGRGGQWAMPPGMEEELGLV